MEPSAFAQRLYYWRTIHNWTPEELAALCRHAQKNLRVSSRSMTAAWIRLMERGADGFLASINSSHLDALAMAMEVPATALTAPPPSTSPQRIEAAHAALIPHDPGDFPDA
jgi:hypothetical protein